MFLQRDNLIQGVYYKFAFSANTPNSLNGSTEYIFKTNIPPRGGTCKVVPASGTVSFLDEHTRMEKSYGYMSMHFGAAKYDQHKIV